MRQNLGGHRVGIPAGWIIVQPLLHVRLVVELCRLLLLVTFGLEKGRGNWRFEGRHSVETLFPGVGRPQMRFVGQSGMS